MNVNISLSKIQYTSLGNAVKNKKGITLHLNKEQIGAEDGFPFKLTQSQIKKFNSGKYTLNLSHSQCKKFVESLLKEVKVGGALPLLALIPLLAKAAAVIGGVGAAAGGVAQVVNAVNNKKNQDKTLAETQRHNKAIENTGGRGIFLAPPLKNGKGLFLKPYP